MNWSIEQYGAWASIFALAVALIGYFVGIWARLFRYFRRICRDWRVRMEVRRRTVGPYSGEDVIVSISSEELCNLDLSDRLGECLKAGHFKYNGHWHSDVYLNIGFLFHNYMTKRVLKNIAEEVSKSLRDKCKIDYVVYVDNASNSLLASALADSLRCDKYPFGEENGVICEAPDELKPGTNVLLLETILISDHFLNQMMRRIEKSVNIKCFLTLFDCNPKVKINLPVGGDITIALAKLDLGVNRNNKCKQCQSMSRLISPSAF